MLNSLPCIRINPFPVSATACFATGLVGNLFNNDIFITFFFFWDSSTILFFFFPQHGTFKIFSMLCKFPRYHMLNKIFKISRK